MVMIRQPVINKETIIKANEIIADYETIHTAQQASEDQYVEAVKRLQSNKDPSESIVEYAMKKGVCKNSWFFYKSALRNVSYRQIRNALLKHEKGVRLKDQSLVDESEKLLKLNIKTFGEASNANPENLKRAKSKRKHMQKLPHDWRVSVCRVVSERYKTAMVVMALCGCRPEELRKGIKIERMGNFIHFTVSGAKVKKHGKIKKRIFNNDDVSFNENYKIVDYKAGQDSRTITFKYDLSSVLLSMLIALLPKLKINQFSTTVEFENKKSFASALRQAGKKLWPERSKNITPIMLRHQFSSDNKALGILSDEEQAAALGHFVTATKLKYGHKNQGKGGLAPVKIVATQQVKISKKNLITDKTRFKSTNLKSSYQ